MSKTFRWKNPPSGMAKELAVRGKLIEPALKTLAKVEAARGEAKMKSGAPWQDQTGFARGALYGTARDLTIELGTTNTEYGVYLEMGTVHMAARPIIGPTLDEVATAYWTESLIVIKGFLGG